MLPLLVYNQLRESINKLTTIKDKGVTMPDCGSECRRFESGLPPPKERLKDKSCKAKDLQDLFFINTIALWKTTKN